MTGAGTGVRRAVLPRHETRMPADYGRPSALTEAELFAGYRVRLEMLRGLGELLCWQDHQMFDRWTDRPFDNLDALRAFSVRTLGDMKAGRSPGEVA